MRLGERSVLVCCSPTNASEATTTWVRSDGPEHHFVTVMMRSRAFLAARPEHNPRLTNAWAAARPCAGLTMFYSHGFQDAVLEQRLGFASS